ncbi:PriCT-2 domain-containing protein, partial [Marinobacter salarius]|uniref:PriCT-2 domain-containing protein n=1 Tax=Marinobacter salarius TaxID=1420917 RepID=UPI0032EC6EDB
PADQQRPLFEIMQQCRRWLLWRQEPNSTPDRKPRKIPYYVNGKKRQGLLDTDTDLQRLAAFDEACRAMSQGEYTGVAFALGPDGSGGVWQGVDIDDVSKTKLSHLVMDAPGYVEVTPSGDGYHVIGYGRPFETMGSNSTGVEAYSHGRFFTVTGNKFQDGGLACIADYAERVIAPVHRANRSSVTMPTGTHTSTAHVQPRTVSELRSALNHLPADEYHVWVNIGLALCCLGNTGRGLWMDWSATSDKFDSSEAAKKWQSFKSTDVSYETVFHTAQQYGWVNPNSNGARIQHAAPTGSIDVVVEEPSIVNIEYLDNPFIPKGQAIGFYGRGESGKSSAAATFCSRNSDRYSTLWITSEESPSHIITRHKHSGGHDKTMGVVSESGFDIYTHLEAAIKDSKKKLAKPLGFVVLDAVVALVTWGKGESANDDGAVKRLIGFIDRMAQAEGVSILMVGHLNKGKGHEHIADAVLGATAWTSSVRLAYMLQKVPEEDYAGFIRTAKTNVNIHFGAFYRTIPVYQMAANIDGFKPSLCKIEFTSERIYGERNLIQAMADDDDVTAEKVNAKQKRIDHIIDRALHVLQDGAEKTRADIQTGLGMLEPSRRDWLAVDESLIRRNVQIRTGERNKNYYQLYPTTPSQ